MKRLKVAVLYSGHQFDYLYGLITAFNKIHEYDFEIIDAHRKDSEVYPEFQSNVKVFKFISKKEGLGLLRSLSNILTYYFKLIKFILVSDADIYHIEWLNYKSARFEELLIPSLIKLRRKKIIYRVHDISTDTLFSESKSEFKIKLPRTKKFFFNNITTFLVHNPYTKGLLTKEGIPNSKIHIIRHGINNSIHNSGITKEEARARFCLKENEKCLLFFGNIAPYKNLENLIESLMTLNNKKDQNIRLIIAGRFRSNQKKYENKINSMLEKNMNLFNCNFRFIKNDEVEFFFKAADALVLPYKFIFQSGLVFLAMTFNIPVIAKNIGGLSYDILENETGIVYENDNDLTSSIRYFYNSSIFTNFDLTRDRISQYKQKYDWEALAERMREVYDKTQ